MAALLARFGAKSLFVLGMTGLLTSTAGMATIPANTIAAIRALDEQAPVEVDAPVIVDQVDEEVGKAVGSGEASYYGHELAGNRTASGERFNPQALTAAHRSLPLGSKLRVTNKANGKSVIVRVNDRGPFVKSRLLDVSLAAAHKIGMVRSGKAIVNLELMR